WRGSDTELRVPGCTDLAHHTDLQRSGQFGGESRGDEDAAPGEAGNDRITPVVAAQLRGEFDPGTVAIGERPQTRPLVHTPGLPGHVRLNLRRDERGGQRDRHER